MRRLCTHSTLRTDAVAESLAIARLSDLRADTNLSFSRFMCSACLLVSWLIAARGFTGDYYFSEPRVLLLLCASHGYRCALADSHRLLDLDRQNRIKNRRSVSYLFHRFLDCKHKCRLSTGGFYQV